MSIVHIAFYPSDWLAGTRGLSDTESGVYITLICRMYEMAGPIERNDERLYRLCGSKSKSAFVKSLEYLISEGKIIETPDGLYNERVAKEINITTEKSTKASAAAQSRWKRKPNKNSTTKDANASAKHMPQLCQSEPEPEPLKKEAKASQKRGSRLPDNWTLPKPYGDWAIGENWPEAVIRAEADKFKDYWHSVAGQKAVKLDWFATWRNWMRNANPPKVINGGGHESTSKSQDRLNAFISGARGSS